MLIKHSQKSFSSPKNREKYESLVQYETFIHTYVYIYVAICTCAGNHFSIYYTASYIVYTGHWVEC